MERREDGAGAGEAAADRGAGAAAGQLREAAEGAAQEGGGARRALRRPRRAPSLLTLRRQPPTLPRALHVRTPLLCAPPIPN